MIINESENNDHIVEDLEFLYRYIQRKHGEILQLQKQIQEQEEKIKDLEKYCSKKYEKNEYQVIPIENSEIITQSISVMNEWANKEEHLNNLQLQLSKTEDQLLIKQKQLDESNTQILNLKESEKDISNQMKKKEENIIILKQDIVALQEKYTMFEKISNKNKELTTQYHNIEENIQQERLQHQKEILQLREQNENICQKVLSNTGNEESSDLKQKIYKLRQEIFTLKKKLQKQNLLGNRIPKKRINKSG